MRQPLTRLFAALLCCGCGAAAPSVDALPFAAAGASAAPDPGEFGPYPVGVRTETLVFQSGAPGTRPRTLVTEVWYPATQASRGAPTVTYDIREVFTPEQQADIEAKRQMSGVQIPLLATAAVRDAAPATAHGTFPLVVFSHGLSAIRWQSTYLTVKLASHGFIVVAPDHEGGTLADVLRGVPISTPAGVQERPRDVRLLLNTFLALPATHPLHGLVDGAHVGVTGHSFGGLTSFRAAALDARITAIVPQCPTSTELALLGLPPAPLALPILIQASRLDRTLSWEDNIAPSWKALTTPATAPRWLLELKTGGHFTMSDLCGFDLARVADGIKLDLPNTDVKSTLSDGCGPPAPEAAVAQKLLAHFAIAFFNAQLKGSTGSLALLSQSSADALGPGLSAVSSAQP